MNDSPEIPRHDGAIDDLAPLLGALQDDGKVGELRFYIARAALGLLTWNIASRTVMGETEGGLNLRHPEVTQLRRLARAGDTETQRDVQPAFLAYTNYLRKAGRLILARLFGEIGRQIAGEDVPAALLKELATVYAELSLFQKALTIWTELESLGARATAQAMNGKGMVQLRQGNLKDAETMFRDAKAYPWADELTRAEATLNLGVTLERQGDLTTAATLYWDAFGAFPADEENHWKALTNLGVIFLKEGRPQNAADAFRVVIDLSGIWTLQTNAMIELMDVVSLRDPSPDNLELRHLERELAARRADMERPSLLVDYLYHLGLVNQRRGQSPDRRWREAIDLAEEHRLFEWAHRIRGELERPAVVPMRREDHQLDDLGVRLLQWRVQHSALV